MDAYVEPRIRTIKLRAALAIGAAAVIGAFGVGYMVAQALDRPGQAAVAEPATAVHTSSDAVAESLLLKQRSPLRGTPLDIRHRRVE